MEVSNIAAENCVVLIYVNINEPQTSYDAHFLRSRWFGGALVDPAGLRSAKFRDRYHHLVAANLPPHSKTFFLLPLK